MKTKTITSYTFDLKTTDENIDEAAAAQALDELELGRHLQNHARQLVALKGGALAGVVVVNRHDD